MGLLRKFVLAVPPLKKLAEKIVLWFPKRWFRRDAYSGDGEDLVLAAFYEGYKNYKGYYVDVGAHDPFRFSNTAFFYRQGWRGINIEPTPDLIKGFKRYRKRDISLNIAIGGDGGELDFYMFNESALNSFNKELSLMRNDAENKYKITKVVPIKVYKLSDILDKYLPKGQAIDFLTVDVEGFDLLVLKSNNWDKYVPKFIMVEQILEKFDVEQLQKDEIYTYLRSLGYSLVARTMRTFIFRHKNCDIQ